MVVVLFLPSLKLRVQIPFFALIFNYKIKIRLVFFIKKNCDDLFKSVQVLRKKYRGISFSVELCMLCSSNIVFVIYSICRRTMYSPQSNHFSHI